MSTLAIFKEIHITPVLTGFAKAPDEIILKILSAVPYSRSRHDTLRLVDRRFRDLLDSNSLRLGVVHHQYPALAALRNPTTISKTDLQAYAKQDRKVKITVCRIYTGDDLHVRALLTDGVHLIDYVMTLIVTAGLTESKKMEIIELTRVKFERLIPGLMRYVLKLVFDTDYKTHFSDIELGYCNQLYYIGTASYQEASGAKLYILMFRRRAFETAFLLNDTHNLTDFVLGDHRRKGQRLCGNPLCSDIHYETFGIIGKRMCIEYRNLLAAYDHALEADVKIRGARHSQLRHNYLLEETQSFAWRMLSYRECTSGDQMPSNVGLEHHALFKEFILESSHDDEFAEKIKPMAATLRDTFTIAFFKAVGSMLRSEVAEAA